MDPITLLPIIAIGIYALFGRKKKPFKKKKKKKCAPYGVDRDKILTQAQTALDQGVVGPDRVAAYVAAALFAKDSKGETIPWPKAAPWQLPAESAAALVCLLAEIKVIVRELPIPEEPGSDIPTPGEILTDLIASEPTPGKFYLIKKNDVALGIHGLMKQALAKVSAIGAGKSQNFLKYLKHMTAGPGTWNYDIYGRDKNTKNWKKYTNSQGRNLGAAWLPRHKNAIAAITNGRMPERNITLSGSKAGDGASYALLWFPPIDKDSLENNVVTSAGMKWDDGSSVLNPPPELLSLLDG